MEDNGQDCSCDIKETNSKKESETKFIPAWVIEKIFYIKNSLFYRKFKRLIPIVIILLWFLSGFYIVNQDEVGVVRRFGKVTESKVSPGIKWRLPWPIETVDKIRTTEIKHMSIGYKILDALQGIPPEPLELQRLTGDTNIIAIKVMVQYQITDPAKFLFNAKEPHWLIRKFGEASLTRIASSMKVDEALTTGKLEIQFALTQEIQKNLDMLETGITIKSCNLQEVHPPEDVVDAFNDVSRAQSDKEKIKSQADAYRNELLPKARGRAQELLNEAIAYRSRTVNKAKGESEKFNSLLFEYRKSPSVTHKRLFLEMLEKVLPKVTKIIIRDKPGHKGRAVIIK